MNPITSIYIPFVDKVVDPEFIARAIEKNGLAKVGSVTIEPYKSSYASILKNGVSKYNQAYVGIKAWEDTEAAYNFIQRLKNPNREARLVYEDDNWWQVEINEEPNKILKPLPEKNNPLKTAQLKSILSGFTSNKTLQLKSIVSTLSQEVELERELESYIHQMDEERALWFSEKQYVQQQ